MQEKGIISTNQFIWMLFCIITSFTALQAPRLLILQARRDAWLAVILAWIMDVLLAVVYAYMGVRFPGKNMVQYSMSILGNKLGVIVGLLFPAYFLIVSSLLQRSLSITLHNAFFPETSERIILMAAYVVIGYASLKGIEVIGRVCEILGPLYLFSIIILFSFVIPEIDINMLKPQLEFGIYPALTGAPMVLSYIGICIIMGMYIPICNHPENGFKAKFTAVSIGASMIIFLVIASIGVFGYEQSKAMTNLSLQLARNVHIGGFFERVEAIWLVIVIGAVIMTSANMIWAFSLGIAQIMGSSTYKPLVIPAIVLSFVIGMTSFKNNLSYVKFVMYSYPIMAIFVQSILEMLLFFAALLLNKRG